MGVARDAADVYRYPGPLDTALSLTGAGADKAGRLSATVCARQFSRDNDAFADPRDILSRPIAADQVPPDAEIAPWVKPRQPNPRPGRPPSPRPRRARLHPP